MVKNTSSRYAIVLGFAAFAQVTAGCIAPTVIGGGTSTTGSGGGSNAGTGGSSNIGAGGGSDVGGGPAVSNTVALRYDELPQPGGGDPVGSSSASGGDPTDPATLFLEIDSGAITCGAPYGNGGGCDPKWHLTVVLPPANQVPGTYAVNVDAVTVSYFEQEDGGSGTCAGGGTNNFDTVQVVSIDSSQVVVTVSGAGLGGTYDPNGSYVVPRCSTPQQSPLGAIALHPDQFPVGPSGSSSESASSVSSGGGIDPSSLIVILGSPLPTCADPFAVTCSSPQWEVTVTLPPGYQTPGVYSLMDSELNASFSEWAPGNPGECNGGGGSFFDGTIEVVSIDAAGLVVRFAGVSSHANELEQDLQVPRCQ